MTAVDWTRLTQQEFGEIVEDLSIAEKPKVQTSIGPGAALAADRRTFQNALTVADPGVWAPLSVYLAASIRALVHARSSGRKEESAWTSGMWSRPG